MHVCSKWLGLTLLFSSSVAVAGPAVLIEQGRRSQSNERIESSTTQESNWNRPEYQEEPDSVETNERRRPASSEQNSENLDGEEMPQATEPAPSVGRYRSLAPGYAESYTSVFEIRRNKRLGVGASFMGRAGFVGLDAELNLLEEHSALVSVGGGPGYTGVSAGYKWTPLHGLVHPTVSFAVSSWVADNSSMNRETSIPAFFGSGSNQASDEKIRQIYLVPAVGIQTVQLSGESAGAMAFVEVLFFTEIPTFDLKPMGSVGARYFF